MAYDVVIIGAGMSGLAAGIRLAYFDKKVLILEKHFRIGGLNSYYTKGGYDLDVGLHAVTNFARREERKKPLIRLLRQLKLGYDEFDLSPQLGSAIKFSDTHLRFSNDFALFKSEVAEKFPREIDGFLKLLDYINDYDELNINGSQSASTREVITSFISDELLVDMILCPLMFYGNPKEDDMDLWQFVIMFKSIFMEGFSRPYEGVRRILNVLEKKYTNCGGELKLKTGVKNIIPEKGGGFSLELEKGEPVHAKKVLSSAGYPETMRLLDGAEQKEMPAAGKMSFMEFVFILNKSPVDLSIGETITFYSSQDSFSYKRPDGLIDLKSGVICCPNNFSYGSPLDYNMIRVTNIANSEKWRIDDKAEYKQRKEECMALTIDEVERYTGGFKDNIIFQDSFTPSTIEKFSGHINGAIYGTEKKVRTGMTDIDGLYLCGTDQGFLGITGAMLSGITIANLYLLK
jgi:phytoene dehydrogenase-like protein